jgi:hypothetical protein
MFEAEVQSLFLGGVVLVILFELIFSILVLRKAPGVKKAMIGHVVCLLIAFFCLGYMLFWPQILPDGGTADRSGQFALFGIFWFIGECCGVAAVMNALSSGKKSRKPEPTGSVKITKL